MPYLFVVEDLNLNCTFEDGFKEWRNSEETEVKWKLGKGETLTPKTGPNFDHTLRNENGMVCILGSC